MKNNYGPAYKALRPLIFIRDHWTCQVCGRQLRKDGIRYQPDSPTVDHITPLADGGTHTPTNLRAACSQCNSRLGQAVKIAQLHKRTTFDLGLTHKW